MVLKTASCYVYGIILETVKTDVLTHYSSLFLLLINWVRCFQ